MALIKCPECNKDISDKSAICIHCGFPLHKNRVFPVGAVIGYDCPKCNVKNMIFKVLSSNSEETKASCTKCDTILTICFDNVVLTQSEYDSVYNDIYDKDIDVAINKIIRITNRDYDTVKKYVIREIEILHQMEQQLNLSHTENLREKIEEQEKKQAILDYQYRNNAECPYCHSKNTKKISGLSKAGSVALWGVFAVGKVSKQWHCNQCNSDF